MHRQLPTVDDLMLTVIGHVLKEMIRLLAAL